MVATGTVVEATATGTADEGVAVTVVAVNTMHLKWRGADSGRLRAKLRFLLPMPPAI